MTKFKIDYIDPATQVWESIETEFEDTPAGISAPNNWPYGAISARDWAEDMAYGLADKGPYKVTELKGQRKRT